MSATAKSSPAMDMSQFQGAFFEEAAEHLADLESLLVRIDVGAPTADEMNAIFRAAHSLKGGSAMFGFNDMTTLTHELESLLDKVRKNELELRAEMIDVLLQSSDLLRAQLAHYSGQPGAQQVAIDAMCTRIRGCLAGRAAVTEAQEPSAGQSAKTPPSVTRTLEIRFPASPEVADLLPDLLAQLAELGALEEVAPATTKRGRRSKRSSAAPDRVVRLTTDTAESVVLALFEFVMDSSKVRITTIEAAKPEGEAVESAAPASRESDNGFGFFEPAPRETPSASHPTPSASHAALPVDAPRAPSDAEPAPRDQRAAPAVDSSIRVSVEKVDQLINQVGELVITQAMLAESVAKLDPIANEKLVSGMTDLERNTRDLQESVMSIRMMPIAFVFNRFPRLVRDLAAKLGKQVQLATQGEGTELDKGLIEKISDPLTHLVRNSIDHGIEPPEVRVAAGKTPAGTVTLRAAHQGGNIIVEVSDDGAGLDRARIVAKARERGMAVSDSMSDQEVWALIFEAGFSTAQVVTDVSGRGVGMDVVRRNIRALGGTVEIESALGIGTRITVRLPLTLAIMDGMAIAVGSETYIVPIASIVESLQVDAEQVRSVAGRGLVIEVRGEYLPVVSLHELFVTGPSLGARASGTMVIVEADGGKTALLIDELLGQHQVVVKSLDVNFHRVHGISGATIMGDGRVALILDVGALTRGRRQNVTTSSVSTQ